MNDVMQVVAIAGVAWVLFGFAGAYIAAAKGRPSAEGAVFGFMLGPIGLLVAVLMPSVVRPAAEPMRDRERGRTPSSEARPKPVVEPQPGRVNATARDDFMADALLEHRLRAESSATDDAAGDPRSDSRSMRRKG